MFKSLVLSLSSALLALSLMIQPTLGAGSTVSAGIGSSISQQNWIIAHGKPDGFMLLFLSASPGSIPSRRLETWFYKKDAVRVMFDQGYRVRVTQLPQDYLKAVPRGELNPLAFSAGMTTVQVKAMLGTPSNTESASTGKHSFTIYRYLKNGSANSFTFVDDRLVSMAAGIGSSDESTQNISGQKERSSAAEMNLRVGYFKLSELVPALPEWTPFEKLAKEDLENQKAIELNTGNRLFDLRKAAASSTSIENAIRQSETERRSSRQTTLYKVEQTEKSILSRTALEAGKLAQNYNLDIIVDLDAVLLGQESLKQTALDIGPQIAPAVGANYIPIANPGSTLRPRRFKVAYAHMKALEDLSKKYRDDYYSNCMLKYYRLIDQANTRLLAASRRGLDTSKMNSELSIYLGSERQKINDESSRRGKAAKEKIVEQLRKKCAGDRVDLLLDIDRVFAGRELLERNCVDLGRSIERSLIANYGTSN